MDITKITILEHNLSDIVLFKNISSFLFEKIYTPLLSMNFIERFRYTVACMDISI